MRLTKHQRTIIFQAMLAEARAKTAQGLTGPDIVRAVEHVKRDLLEAARQGLTLIPVPTAPSPPSASLVPHPSPFVQDGKQRQSC